MRIMKIKRFIAIVTLLAAVGLTGAGYANDPLQEGAPEEETLLERSSAPTARDLRAAAKDLLTIIEAEPDSTPPKDGLQQEEA
jgi:hypothetical protein